MDADLAAHFYKFDPCSPAAHCAGGMTAMPVTNR